MKKILLIIAAVIILGFIVLGFWGCKNIIGVTTSHINNIEEMTTTEEPTIEPTLDPLVTPSAEITPDPTTEEPFFPTEEPAVIEPTVTPTPTPVKNKKMYMSPKKMTIWIQQGTVFPELKNSDGKNVKWSSSDEKICRVLPGGYLKGYKKGKVTITAKADGKKYTCKVTVKAKEKAKAKAKKPKSKKKKS